jgi:hypothetical protein
MDMFSILPPLRPLTPPRSNVLPFRRPESDGSKKNDKPMTGEVEVTQHGDPFNPRRD